MFKYLSYIIIILILLSKQSLAEKVTIFEFTNKEFSELKSEKLEGRKQKLFIRLVKMKMVNIYEQRRTIQPQV